MDNHRSVRLYLDQVFGEGNVMEMEKLDDPQPFGTIGSYKILDPNTA